MRISTVVGEAEVLHRLALGVEVRDAVTTRTASGLLRVGREVPGARERSPDGRRSWPCLDLEPGGGGRFKLRHHRPLPTGNNAVRLRIDDPSRCYVPRRFDVDLWDLADLEAADDQVPGVVAPPAPGAYVPVRSRLFRPWLLPGAAYGPPRGTTGLRGRVALPDGTPVRWARIYAASAANDLLGYSHGDDRGEFLLVLTDTGTVPPPPTSFAVRLSVYGPDPARPIDPEDVLSDLPPEVIPRSANPAPDSDLDNDVLRGLTQPTGYVALTTAINPFAVPVGEVLSISTVTFDYP